jgi:hypothetical protein
MGYSSEQGTTNFIIQHSTNGTDWDNVGTTAAAGNSSVNKFYSYVHTAPSSGANYYRLIEQDFDGKQSYSKVIYIQLNGNSSHFSVYSAVASNGLLNIRLDKAATIQIFNSAGSQVMLKELQPGVQQLNLGKLSAGVYRIRANAETISFIIP